MGRFKARCHAFFQILSLGKYSYPAGICSIAVIALIAAARGGRLEVEAAADNQKNVTEAARLNDIGVALMNQQLTEKAIAKFDEAHAADPASAIPVMNKGIALVYLRKLPEAEAALKQAATMDPNNPRTW
ncbi:MAG: hypothetical protein JOZ29_09360, partial [Deltaproteobacteria bacterium]|nr:hypothetical protein [Deltaproteobacteria bacterium]